MKLKSHFLIFFILFVINLFLIGSTVFDESSSSGGSGGYPFKRIVPDKVKFKSVDKEEALVIKTNKASGTTKLEINMLNMKGEAVKFELKAKADPNNPAKIKYKYRDEDDDKATFVAIKYPGMKKAQANGTDTVKVATNEVATNENKDSFKIFLERNGAESLVCKVKFGDGKLKIGSDEELATPTSSSTTSLPVYAPEVLSSEFKHHIMESWQNLLQSHTVPCLSTAFAGLSFSSGALQHLPEDLPPNHRQYLDSIFPQAPHSEPQPVPEQPQPALPSDHDAVTVFLFLVDLLQNKLPPDDACNSPILEAFWQKLEQISSPDILSAIQADYSAAEQSQTQPLFFAHLKTCIHTHQHGEVFAYLPFVAPASSNETAETAGPHPPSTSPSSLGHSSSSSLQGDTTTTDDHPSQHEQANGDEEAE